MSPRHFVVTRMGWDAQKSSFQTQKAMPVQGIMDCSR